MRCRVKPAINSHKTCLKGRKNTQTLMFEIYLSTWCLVLEGLYFNKITIVYLRFSKRGNWHVGFFVHFHGWGAVQIHFFPTYQIICYFQRVFGGVYFWEYYISREYFGGVYLFLRVLNLCSSYVITQTCSWRCHQIFISFPSAVVVTKLNPDFVLLYVICCQLSART